MNTYERVHVKKNRKKNILVIFICVSFVNLLVAIVIATITNNGVYPIVSIILFLLVSFLISVLWEHKINLEERERSEEIAQERIRQKELLKEQSMEEERIAEQRRQASIEQMKTSIISGKKLAKDFEKILKRYFDMLSEYGDIYNIVEYIYQVPAGNDAVRAMMTADGFKTATQNPDIKDIVSVFSNELQERIKATNELDENSNYGMITYACIREGLIERYFKKYRARYGYETIEEYVENCDEDDFDIVLITCYYLQKSDEFIAINAMKDKLLEQARLLYKQKDAEKLRRKLFGNEKTAVKREIVASTAEVAVVQRQEQKVTIKDIDYMDGRDFEIFIAEFFEKRGYEVELTPSSGDYGIDVIIKSEFSKVGIQTKCYNDKVPNAAVQEAVTGISHYGLDKAMVITNSYFQPSAIRLAKDNKVILWNRDKLIEELNRQNS